MACRTHGYVRFRAHDACFSVFFSVLFIQIIACALITHYIFIYSYAFELGTEVPICLAWFNAFSIIDIQLSYLISGLILVIF